MFFEYRQLMGDEHFGGLAKAANRLARTYTDPPKFHPVLQTWVNLMLDLCCPRVDLALGDRPYREEDKDVPVNNAEALAVKRKRWTPNHVDKFWTEFLDTHMLPVNDRVVHDHPRATGEFYEGVQSVSCPSYGGGSPRKVAMQDDDAGMDLERGQPATLETPNAFNPSSLDCLPSLSHSTPTPLSPPRSFPRRIARIVEQRNQAKGTIGPGPETNHGGKVPRSARHSGRLPRVTVSGRQSMVVSDSWTPYDHAVA